MVTSRSLIACHPKRVKRVTCGDFVEAMGLEPTNLLTARPVRPCGLAAMKDPRGQRILTSHRLCNGLYTPGMLYRSIEGIRRWLNRELFPDPPLPQKTTPSRMLLFGGLAILAIAVQMARMWPSAPLNSIWADDGAIFLRDAMKESFIHAATTPYNGYLQLVSRLVAFPVARLPLAWFAPVMAISGAAIVAGCALIVWSASAAHIKNQYLRATLAVMVVLLPITGVETLDNVTNSIWFLFFAAFWILLWRPATLARTLPVAAVLLLAVLSSAGTILLFPLWLLRLIAIRDRRDGAIVGAYAVGVAIQLSLSWDVRNERGENASSFARAVEAALHPPQWHWDLIAAYLQRIVGGVVAGQRINPFLWVRVGTLFEVALGAALIGFVIFTIAGTDGRARVLVPLAAAASVGIFLYEGYQRWSPNGQTFLWAKGSGVSEAIWDDQHYFVLPTLLLLSAIFVGLDAQPNILSATVWRTLRIGFVVGLLFVALLSFNVSDSAFRGSLSWSKSLDIARSQCLRDHAKTAQVKIAPENTQSSWMIPIACSELLGLR